jgi:hypothetical protein
MSEPTESEKCNICFEKFTTTVRARIQCPFCPSATCKTCLQQYLLSLSEDPHCMGCKREWNREFLDIHLPTTFRKGPLRQQRRKVLVDREMAMLPSMQVYVEATFLRNKAWQKYKECGDATDRLTIERSKLDQRISILERALQSSELDIPAEIIAHIEKASDLQKQIMKLNLNSRFYYNQYNRNLAFLEGRDGTKQVRQFIMKCPGNAEDGEACRGFLSSQWKCGTCQKYFCNECHALLGDRNDGPHTCNEDSKATAALIRKETRPCPKCGIRISKIEGCDQMWCTSCQTTFSWNTGQILHNVRVHNPHYYEYLRQTGGNVPRELGDIPCGGIPDYYVFIRNIRTVRGLSQKEIDEAVMIHRSLSDISQVRLPEYPLRRPANDNRDLDVNYLMGNLTKEDWARNLELKETKFERRKEIGLVLQTLVHVGAEKLTEIGNFAVTGADGIPGIRQRVQELNQLRDFSNTALKARGEQMGIVVPQIEGAHWTWGYTKRKQSAAAAAAAAAATTAATAPATAPATAAPQTAQ